MKGSPSGVDSFLGSIESVLVFGSKTQKSFIPQEKSFTVALGAVIYSSKE
jgi:hypothetical protein